eukprot:gnl/MRDRNA2_/MRDRNA2_90354_c0_seq1.p1 gnl/MRDRNA2_/MRDRNA2_90354_c0~~gnl/MRDRNA2_/MRDRNA2_90354_c0_seq1.p1  ORF type:complete len:493 (-),score=87.80 gnl/MRDRNA2_/MRDRNA2_90354_c0_seq1:294-1691(-)
MPSWDGEKMSWGDALLNAATMGLWSSEPGEIFYVVVVLALGFGIAYMDTCWAAPGKGHKIWPRCEGPRSRLDGFMALTALVVKVLATSWLFVGGQLRVHLLWFTSFKFWGAAVLTLAILMVVFYLPCMLFTDMLKKQPTIKDLSDQICNEKIDGDSLKNFCAKPCEAACPEYIRKNMKQYVMGIVRLPLICCQPRKFVTVLKSFTLLIVIKLLGTIMLMYYIMVRCHFSAFTWKLFTFQGWVEEVLDIMKMKNRSLSLDYPRFWNEERHAQEQRAQSEASEVEDDSGEGISDLCEEGKAGEDNFDKKASEQKTEDHKDVAMAQAEAKTACIAVVLPVLAELIMVCVEFVLELIGDIIFQLLVIGIGVLVAEKALEKYDSNQEATGQATNPPAPPAPLPNLLGGPRAAVGKTFQVQVPMNARPGQKIQATTPSGLVLQVEVPANISPGQLILVEDPGQQQAMYNMV